jgi:hypothetical protein
MIHDNMSKFTAPGLAAALTNAIKVGLVGKKFVAGQAKMTLDKFFDR